MGDPNKEEGNKEVVGDAYFNLVHIK